MLGHAKAIIDRAVSTGGIEPRRATDRVCIHAGYGAEEFRTVALCRNELGPVLRKLADYAAAHRTGAGDRPHRPGVTYADMLTRLDAPTPESGAAIRKNAWQNSTR